jgi:hypothetical protein
MKAEHRKELETNALADRVGRAVQSMKQAPQKRTMLWVVLAGVVLVVIFVLYRRAQLQKVENSLNWVTFEDGRQAALQQLVKQDPQSIQAKAAHFEANYVSLRRVLALLATHPKEVLPQLDEIKQSYVELAKACKDDEVLLPEALFAQAVIEETRIIKDDDNWKAALAAYKEVADNHKETAFGKLARKRVEILENKDKRKDLLDIYRDLRIEFVREDRLATPPPSIPIQPPPVAIPDEVKPK